MDLIPDWAPNIHPLIVHFPIALLFTAVFLDAAALLRRESRLLRDIPLVLYTLGTASAAVSYFTGRYASDNVDIPTEAITVLNEHSDLALYTLILFGVYTLIRIFLTLRVSSNNVWLRIVMVVIPLLGLRLVFHTAEHGAELVFRLGVGVAAVADDHGHTDEHAAAVVIPDSIRVETDGSWSWVPGEGAVPLLRNEFEIMEGSLDSVAISASDSGLVIQTDGRRLIFTTRTDVAGLEMVASLDMTAFDGEVLLVHNVTSSADFDYFGLSSDAYIHGQQRSGQRSSFGRAAADPVGVTRLRSVSAGRHYRGYVNDELVTHGHAAAAPPGTMGLLIDGRGSIVVKRIGSTTVN